MADTIGQAELKTDYPVTSGLAANQKHEGRQINLVPQSGSLFPRSKEGKGVDA